MTEIKAGTLVKQFGSAQLSDPGASELGTESHFTEGLLLAEKDACRQLEGPDDIHSTIIKLPARKIAGRHTIYSKPS